MLVPKLRFKREDGTDYPEWKEKPFVSFCDVVTKQTGFDYSKTIKQALLTKQEDNTLPYLQTKNFSGKNFNYSTDYYIPIEVASQFEQIILDRKCLLFSIVGASVGNIALFPNTTKCFLSGAICVAKPIKEEQTAYLYYFMCSESGQSQIRNATKGSGQATVTIEDIRAFSIKTSCPEEQQKIAGFLSTVDEVITQSEAEVRNLEQQKKSAMQKIFSQELRFKREDGTEYPEREMLVLQDVARYVTTTGTMEKANFVGTKNMQKGCAGVIFNNDTQTIVKGIAFAHNDILVSNIRPYLQKAWKSDRDGVCSTDVLCIRANNEISSDYLYTIISSDAFFDYAMQGAKGTKMPRGDKKHIMEMPIFAPCLEEQQKIADFLSALDEAINYAKQELDKWKELKKGLLQQMFV